MPWNRCRHGGDVEAMMRTRTMVGAGAGIAAGGVLLGWSGVTSAAWLRYGRMRPKVPLDALAQRFLPTPEVVESHAIRVSAPASITFAVARSVPMQESTIVRAIFRGRERLMRVNHAPFPPGGTVDQLLAVGWGILAERPGREIVLGVVTQPWRGNVQFRALAPDDFASFEQPGYVKIVVTLSVEARENGTAVFRTQTRVATTDATARTKFRRYWAVFSPGIVLIRRALVRAVKREAERRHQANRSPRVVPVAGSRERALRSMASQAWVVMHRAP